MNAGRSVRSLTKSAFGALSVSEIVLSSMTFTPEAIAFGSVFSFDADDGGPGVLRVAHGVLHRAADRERDVVGRERRAVVPLDARVQVERPGQAVGTDLPRVSEVGDRLPGGAVRGPLPLEQLVEHQLEIDALAEGFLRGRMPDRSQVAEPVHLERIGDTAAAGRRRRGTGRCTRAGCDAGRWGRGGAR